MGILLVLIPVSNTVWAANNYADVTGSYRVCPIQFVKTIYDAGPWSVFAIQKIGDKSSGMIWSWHSEDNSKEFLETVLSTHVAQGVDAALIRDDWRGADDTTSAMIDVSKSDFGGIGVVVPFGENATAAKFGPSLNMGKNLVGYAQLQSGAKPYLGLGWYPKGANLDLTIGPDHSWWFRASRPFSHGKETIIPELRLRGSEGEVHIGFAIGVAY